MRKRLMATAAAILLCAPAHADKYDDIVREQMAVSHLPGVAIAVVDKGRVTKLQGYGEANLEWSQPAGPDTRFQLASATKLFTAILLMRQVEQGRLNLDDPISRFFKDAPESWSRIKVRQLANHTSGLSEDPGTPAANNVEEAVAAAMPRPLAYEPGSEARYGFTDFTVLRAILEKVGGATLPELLQREIAAPAGLTDTGFAMTNDQGPARTGDVLPRRASTYGWDGTRQRTSDFHFVPLGYAAGGLYSSARDLAKLFVALDSGSLLKPESLTQIATPAALTSGRKGGFGIGWTVKTYRGVPVVGHSGGPALADILRIPSTGRTIIVLTNQQNFYPMLAERIADLTLPQQVTAPVPDDRPQVGTNVRAMFDAALARRDIAPSVADKKASDMLGSGFGQALVQAVGPVRTVSLVKVEPNGARHYRVDFERKSMDWLFEADGQNRITSLRPAS